MDGVGAIDHCRHTVRMKGVFIDLDKRNEKLLVFEHSLIVRNAMDGMKLHLSMTYNYNFLSLPFNMNHSSSEIHQYENSSNIVPAMLMVYFVFGSCDFV